MQKINWEFVIDVSFLIGYGVLCIAGFIQLLQMYGRVRGII